MQSQSLFARRYCQVNVGIAFHLFADVVHRSVMKYPDRDSQPGARASCEPIGKLLPAHIRVPARCRSAQDVPENGRADSPVFYAAFLALADLPSLRASCELSLSEYFITFPVPVADWQNDKQGNIQIHFLFYQLIVVSLPSTQIISPLSCSNISSKHSRCPQMMLERGKRVLSRAAGKGKKVSACRLAHF